jgi:cysteinyl-tRNA synthetase
MMVCIFKYSTLPIDYKYYVRKLIFQHHQWKYVDFYCYQQLLYATATSSRKPSSSFLSSTSSYSTTTRSNNITTTTSCSSTTESTSQLQQQQQRQQLHLYNSLSKRIEPISTSIDYNDIHTTTATHTTNVVTTAPTVKGIAIYTCGPTVYGPAHLGHARTYIIMDIIRRCIEYQHQQQHYSYTIRNNETRVTTNNNTSIPSIPSIVPPISLLPPPPLFVLNITDVDDKIIHTANDRNMTPISLARQYETEFWYDWDILNCLRPHVITRVTEYVVSHIIPYIQQLIQQQFTYILLQPNTDDSNSNNNNGIYFDICAFEQINHPTKYGKLGPAIVATPETYDTNHDHILQISTTPNIKNESQHLHGPPIRTDKRDPRDFVLWRFKSNQNSTTGNSQATVPINDIDETTMTTSTTSSTFHDIGWMFRIPNTNSSYYGRPGWHIECSAMIDGVQQQFNATHNFTIHAGGIDLQFPHHTNEIVQAEAYYSTNQNNSNTNSNIQSTSCHHHNHHTEWISHWIHTGHLHIDGMKMSKSLKNFITIQEFLSGTRSNSSIHSGTNCNNAEQQQQSMSTRADDLRIWCLGLSGSYRSTAVYSEERLQEANTVRNKIVRFLLDGEEWLLRHADYIKTDVQYCNHKKWRPKDYTFYTSVNDAIVKSKCAIMNDIDGATYVEQMVQIAELGRLYLKDETTFLGPTEPICIALKSIRDLLSLVGFTDATCLAGISCSTSTNTSIQSDVVNHRAIINELAKFRSAVRRAAIDDHKKQKDVPVSDNMKKVLELCDDVRDNIFPTLGIEFLDGKGIEIIDGNGNISVDNWRYCTPKQSNKPSSSNGVFKPTKPVLSNKYINDLSTLPKTNRSPTMTNDNEELDKQGDEDEYDDDDDNDNDNEYDDDNDNEYDDDDENDNAGNENSKVEIAAKLQKSKTPQQLTRSATIYQELSLCKRKKPELSPLRVAMKASPIRKEPPETYFQTGLYTGLFVEYDQFGFPTKHADGTIISNTVQKKLMKIFNFHIKMYNKSKIRKKKKNILKRKREKRAHELLDLRKLPKVPPPPDAFW